LLQFILQLPFSKDRHSQSVTFLTYVALQDIL